MSNLISQKIVESITDKAHEHYEQTVALLEKIVNLDSYSRDKEDIERVATILDEELIELGFITSYTPQQEFANQLTGIRRDDNSGKSILLLGHMDTVFVAGTAIQRPFTYDKKTNRYHGPGVADMKGGLAIIIGALRILKELGLSTGPVEVMFTGDEELGSPASTPFIEEAAHRAKVAFVTEPGRSNGNVVIKRKGSGHGKISIKGKAAHSGVAFDKGISANVELAHKVLALHELNQNSSGVNVNSGIIQGGTSNNCVPESSTIHIHFSFWNISDGEKLLKHFQRITDGIKVPGATASLQAQIACLPMEATTENTRLFEMVVDCAKLLNFDLKGKVESGASDAGRVSTIGVPCICGMGPVGGEYHTADEYVEADSITQRTALLALSILAANTSF